MKPLCFILMPFGKKKDRSGRLIDFDAIYRELIKPAVVACHLEPIRADEEHMGGSIHKPMFERLILCEYAIADLTTSNANVFYELGIRHAIRPYTTIPISAFDSDLPFDLVMQRTLKYELNQNGKLLDATKSLKELTSWIMNQKNDNADSPVFDLVEDLEVHHNLSHEKTDLFRKQNDYNENIKEKLLQARNAKLQVLEDLHDELKPLEEKEAGVVIDLFLSYRAYSAWDQMVKCFEEMNRPLQGTKLVQEQLAFALNRKGERKKAIKILEGLIAKYGADPETNSLLGRVFKDSWKENEKAGNISKARGLLKLAINKYREGFEADWRDAYPGINLVTLSKVNGEEEIVNKYLPLVRFAVERKIEKSDPDYWDLATMLELSVIGEDFDKAEEYLEEALYLIPDQEYWMAETTSETLEMLREHSEDASYRSRIDLLINELKSQR
ncbi:TRAFs-binding domain-containing protein [Portibacter marinus]|uniref:TRAFs-binding domain-containing protein n=1 Tax=Portibacter marinus TaxID=2898660 RepID=UPI001F41731E|nr:TRAFs-binding domain-containing protein [Portibacter marinus]